MPIHERIWANEYVMAERRRQRREEERRRHALPDALFLGTLTLIAAGIMFLAHVIVH
jgi:hypothetical protein